MIGFGYGGDYTDIFVLRLYWEKRRSAWSGLQVFGRGHGCRRRVAAISEGGFEDRKYPYHIGDLGPVRVLEFEIRGDAVRLFDVVGRRRATRMTVRFGYMLQYANACWTDVSRSR